MKKIRVDTRCIIGIVGLAVSVYWFAVASKFPSSTFDGTPGAGFFPKILSVVFGFLSICMIIRALKNPQLIMNFKNMEEKSILRLALLVPAIIIFLLIWKYIHFIPAFMLLMFGLTSLFGIKWWKGLIFSAVFTLLVYFLFTTVLQVMLRY